jgi:hypothetical protein
MQGSLIGDSPEILCAYPEPIPALHHAAPSAVTRRGKERDATIAIEIEPGEDLGEDEAASLIFERDWPDS